MGDHLFVLPAGEAVDWRTLDVKSAATGRYLASLRLPIGLNVSTGRTADLVAVSLEEHPAIVQMR